MSSFESFVKIVYSTKDKVLLEDFLLAITTPRERQELVTRIEIIERLIAGEPQQKIAKELGVGIATITRGSKELALGRFKLLRGGHEKGGHV